ncbi:MAG TPA: hypothetical protein VFA06_02880 [Actinocrinis sp.]|jgi:uncharacterized protein YukE|uniref:hypothetical protein n=1 Tax=Actinocrinis sp. TaxID=1920516 RepID=UPI002D501FFD|nr:hypothetical protein [Actinocrinis sp.]HZU54792.1 hypothetical protein [Actinocrinis sp.]
MSRARTHHWTHRYDRACEAGADQSPEAYRDHAHDPIDEAALAQIGRTHLSHVRIPSIPVPGLGTLEKKLIYWVCEHTGAPNPFHALERLTGDCAELLAAERAWEAAFNEIEAVAASIRAAAQPVRATWTGAEAERFGTALDAYLAELDVLAGCVRTTRDCLKAVRSEAQLAESTVQMLINLLLGSLGGLIVAELMTAGTVTPVAAAQVQMELTYVAKKIATIGGKLSALYSDVIKVLDTVRGFKRIEAMRFVFDLAPGVTSAL